jgi:glutathione S-transferase
MLTLYDASRCPYCARVRIVLAEKQVDYNPVEIDLAERPEWLFEKNPLGKVPVLEDGSLTLPESRVIMEYLEERFPVPSLLPVDLAERARVRLWFEQFDVFSDAYYRVLFNGGPARELESALARLDAALGAGPFFCGSQYGLADIAYVPWIIRVSARTEVDMNGYGHLSRWLERLSRRPAIAIELERASVATR